jgi:hypothetical protein
MTAPQTPDDRTVCFSEFEKQNPVLSFRVWCSAQRIQNKRLPVAIAPLLMRSESRNLGTDLTAN